MPYWLIDLFGSRQLDQAFWAMTLAPLPIWVALVFFPRHRLTKIIAWPGFMAPVLSLAYVFLFWQAWEFGLPRVPVDLAARSTRVFLFHPLVFLVLWAHLQMANLFIAQVLLHDARARRMAIPCELALCWLFAPVAVLLYGSRRVMGSLTKRRNDRRKTR